MFFRSFRTTGWLIAAVYLLDGVLAGAAHVHGPLDSHNHCQTTQAATPHSHHECGHSHHHVTTEPAATHSHDVPAAPHQHDDCAACRYSSLSAAAPALVALPEFPVALELVSVRAPSKPILKIVSRCRSRGPPAVA